MSAFDLWREELAADRHRPLYHFLAPSNFLGDPNGTIWWKGAYHLFYGTRRRPGSPCLKAEVPRRRGRRSRFRPNA